MITLNGKKKILVVDDDNDVLFTARLVLRGLFETVDVLDDPGLIPGSLKNASYDIILLDMNFSRGDTSGRDGIKWLDFILKTDPDACVLMTTAYGEINLAVQAMKQGAADFIIKPWRKDQLMSSIVNAIDRKKESMSRQDEVAKEVTGRGNRARKPVEIISQSKSMSVVFQTIEAVAPTDATVLIMGENGTGKELVANAIHENSPRKDRPFVHVDLGSLPETLFESELFGHTRGAFTDAREERSGRFETAGGGTLFLDEIGNLNLPLQAKILTAIQKREIVRIGSNKPVQVDIRLVSATNMPLYDMAESFRFRQDLLYRINTVEIILPPLRERKEDIALLASHFLHFFCNQYNKPVMEMNNAVLNRLQGYNWPGNIRELAHCIERAVILNKSGKLLPDDLNLRARSAAVPVEDMAVTVEDYEKKAIITALEKHKGNLSKTADELKIARSTLYRKIAHFGILSDNIIK